ncbi:MAG TPA: chemotaxis protein CheW, partial [Spirochaetia bacterium]|nr:chemotaxis protein CheW [Spirochaetia bacterium]
METLLDDYREADTDQEFEGESGARKSEIDFKLVTFTLAGRQYGIDIMNVKEISKANRFTYVPNAPAFVEGVYNLRGEIITIINLRKMFHLPAQERRKEDLANILILHIQDSVIGVIVDAIENVLGVHSKDIQPRHPLFTDIQMKYISGVIEVKEKLYVILDVDRVFGEEEEKEKDELPAVSEKQEEAAPRGAAPAGKKKAPATKDDLAFQFIRDTLATFAHFYVDAGNEPWVKERLREWKTLRERSRKDIQLQSLNDAEDFLDPFFSPYTGMLWGDEYRAAFEEILWKDADTVKAWNPGTGKGSEAFSVCAILRLKFPSARLK